MIIRDETEEDALTACDVMRRSIAELCVADPMSKRLSDPDLCIVLGDDT
jgi:hypothetical protein